MTKDQIREILMANGFTVKEGQTDLKPYVYAAITAILQAATRDAPLYECNNEECGWSGKREDTVHPKHDASTLLCPRCHETTEATRDAASADAVDAQRYRQLKKSGAIIAWAHVGPWVYGETIDAEMDKWIAASEPKEPK